MGFVISVFVPSRGFLFFYREVSQPSARAWIGFRPLTGISLFLCVVDLSDRPFQSPRFRPLTGISLFLFWPIMSFVSDRMSFRPLTGISLFLLAANCPSKFLQVTFSSPHGDFSFSIKMTTAEKKAKKGFRPLTGISLFLYNVFFTRTIGHPFSSPHGDFSFSMTIPGTMIWPTCRFRPLTGISLFLSYLIFPL